MMEGIKSPLHSNFCSSILQPKHLYLLASGCRSVPAPKQLSTFLILGSVFSAYAFSVAQFKSGRLNYVHARLRKPIPGRKLFQYPWCHLNMHKCIVLSISNPNHAPACRLRRRSNLSRTHCTLSKTYLAAELTPRYQPSCVLLSQM